ncbi:MAG: hypothetical protein Q9168_007026 [Polycauliona sp. 1 TL-2023]
MPRADQSSDDLCKAMQKSTLHDTDQTEANVPLVLDRLPTEIQRLIYVNLLKGDLVRGPPDENLVRSYRFHTAILSVCKSIHAIAHRILYQENHFAVVSGNYDYGWMIQTLKVHRVAIISAKPAIVARFKHHVVRIHIAYPFEDTQYKYPKPNEVRHSFVALHSELPDMVRMLQTMDAVTNGSTNAYRIKFKMEKPHSMVAPLAQRLVLEPFRQLGSACLSVKIFGLENAYTQGLLHDMTLPFQWTRAVEWRLYDMMAFHFRLGEDASRTANWALAVSHFTHCYTLRILPVRSNDRLGHSLDSNWNNCTWFLYAAARTNIVLLGLKHPSLCREGHDRQWLLKKASWVDQPSTPAVTKLRSRAHHYRGLIYILSDNDFARALQEFQTAERLVPGDATLESHIRIARQRLGQVTGTPSDITADQIPLEPFTISDQPGNLYAPSDLIATERAILRKLGYKGDLLEHIPASKPVDQSYVDTVEQGLEKLKSHPSGYNPKAPVWLSVIQAEENGPCSIMYEQ